MNQTEYRICNRCIMDSTSDPTIRFDNEGHCNYCVDYLEQVSCQQFSNQEINDRLENVVREIKHSRKKDGYNCILGISGGLDSSYVLFLAKKMGLSPLAVHVDNGWNSELAVSNVEKLCKILNVDLYTHVIDWEEFRDLQLAFFQAHVVDIEMLTDQALSAVLYQVANRYKVKYIIAGTNIATEGMDMPESWSHMKKDTRNINAIHKKFGKIKKMKTYPQMKLLTFLINKFVKRINWVSLLDYIPNYSKETAIQELEKNVGWRPYEKKHYESIFTRFYQGYILPKKFHIDKRRQHYSNLICSDQLAREEALKMMDHGTYESEQLLNEDYQYVLKKLGFSNKEFEDYLAAPAIPHEAYPSDDQLIRKLKRIQRFIKNFRVKYYAKTP